MGKPLYILRAERELACENLVDLLTWHVESDELERALEGVVTLGDRYGEGRKFIEAKINARDRRTRGELLILWQDVLDAVFAVHACEKAEIAELIACGGKLA